MYSKLLGFFLLTVALATSARIASAQENFVPRAISGETIPCPMPLPATEVEGETIVCGQIEVPENWDDPSSPPITITYARQVSKSLSPLADPIIFFSGGPGGSVLASQGSFGFDFSYLRETRDVIVWDQRGNRYSADLLCPQEVVEPVLAAAAAGIAELGEFTLTLQDDPQAALDYARQQVKLTEAPVECAAYFAAQGRDVTQYNTSNTARDAIALMDHLDYPVYNLFGISYGTQVALAIADYYGANPDADLPPIRSAVIDGVFPVNIHNAEDALVTSYNILRIFTDCEADAACGAAYPGIRQTLIDLLAELEAAPLVAADGSQVSLADVRDMLITAVETQKVALIPYFPRMVAELAQGDLTTFAVAQGVLAGTIDPASVAATGPDGNLLDPISLEAATLADELRGVADRLDTLGDKTDDLAAAIEEADTVADLYINLLYRYLADAGPSKRGVYASMVEGMFGADPARQTRQGLIVLAGMFPATEAGELNALANLLSDVEVREVWAALTDSASLQRLDFFDAITNAVVKCNDRGATYKAVEGWAFLNEFEAPQLITNLEMLPSYQARCEYYGIPTGEYAVPPAATTDLPVLVMNGGLDHATPVEWAEVAWSTLPNAQLVIVPMTEHGSTRYSKCTQDIAHSFFLNPEGDLQTSCVEAFRPVFVLPDDALPTAA